MLIAKVFLNTLLRYLLYDRLWNLKELLGLLNYAFYHHIFKEFEIYHVHLFGLILFQILRLIKILLHVQFLNKFRAVIWIRQFIDHLIGVVYIAHQVLLFAIDHVCYHRDFVMIVPLLFYKLFLLRLYLLHQLEYFSVLAMRPLRNPTGLHSYFVKWKDSEQKRKNH